MIHVRKLVKSYPDLQKGQFIAVDQVSFDAMPGQIFGLLGPNGAGKTTVLRILSTVLKPTSGKVTINGFDVVAHDETGATTNRFRFYQHRHLRSNERLGTGRVFRATLRGTH